LSAFREDKNRKVIPRWRSVARALTQKEFEPVPDRTVPVALDLDSTFKEKLVEWTNRQDLPAAIELLGAAALANREGEARSAAEFVLSNPGSPLTHRLARQALDGPSTDNQTDSPQQEIARLRSLVRSYPRDALAWLDLGLAFTNAGASQKAKEAMEVALALAPRNRFVLRSVVRGLLHNREPERASWVIERSPSTPLDPWLISVEIALSMITGRESDLVKVGRSLLKSASLPAFHLGELASSLATLEASSGDIRTAKKLFKQSLVDPTENCVAQARWAAQQEKVLDFDPLHLRTPLSFEARARALFHAGQWKQALGEAIEWLHDQPFSTVPAVLATYLASTSLEDHKHAVELARTGLRANPRDPFLLNNLAFGLANLGNLNEARISLSRILPDPDEKSVEICRIATLGLIEFRAGNSELGRRLYRDAIDSAEAAKMKRLTARARIFYALEEARIGSPVAAQALSVGDTISKELTDLDTIHLRQRLLDAISRQRG